MIAGVHFVRKLRPGKLPVWYVYAYRGGPQVLRHEGRNQPKLSPAQLRAIGDACDQAQARDTTSLRSLLRLWRSCAPDRPSSPEWERLSPNTKKTWGSALDQIERKWGDTPLVVWNDPRMIAKVIAWRDSRASTPRAADMGVTVLRALLEFGRLRAIVSFNAADKIPKIYRGGDRAEIVWTADDLTAFLTKAAELDMQHVADGLRLASLTGLRREDLVTLKWSQVTDVAIVKKAHKRSQGRRLFASMPRIPALDSLLEELRSRHRADSVETVLVNRHGRPWTGDGFTSRFNAVRDAAGIVHIDGDTGEERRKHLHDIRGTFATKLMTEIKLTDQEIADIMGWAADKVARIRRVYVDQSSIIVAIGRRIQETSVNRAVNS